MSSVRPTLLFLAFLTVFENCSTPPSTIPDLSVDSRASVDSAACPDPAGDSDGDGILNVDEGCPARDTDGDKVPDWQDMDSDDDGVSDHIESGRCSSTSPSWPCDSDGDGTPDYLDVDSDNDGLADGDEDFDGDGLLGCCLQSCNQSTGNKQCVLTQDGCGTGQACVNGLCTPAVVFDCSQGETNPAKPDTFGDGKQDSARGSFVCRDASDQNPYGRKPVKLYSGPNWTLALPPTVNHVPVNISGASSTQAAAVLDANSISTRVAGFAVVRPTQLPDVQDEVKSALQALATNPPTGPGTVSHTVMGAAGKSHDLYDVFGATTLEIKVSSPTDVSALRDNFVALFLGVQTPRLTNLPPPFAPQSTEFVVRFVAVRRFRFQKNAQGQLVKDARGYPIDDGDQTYWRLLVLGAVAAKSDYDDSAKATYFTVQDVSNDSAVATWCKSLANRCDARTLSGALTVSLDRFPISTSLGVALDTAVLPRSRSQGFDYDETTRGLLLVGKPPPVGSHLVVSYKTWEQATCE